jgi:hypothetical protein
VLNDASEGSAITRLANVIAIFAMKDIPAEEAAVRLDMLGFSAKEIGGVLGKNENYVHMVKSAKKTKKGRSNASSKKKR